MEKTDSKELNKNALQTRKIALQIIHTVLDKNQPLDQVFDNSNGFIGLSEQRDRAFVKMLATTTIRHLGQIDNLITKTLKSPDQEMKPAILQHVLRLGVCQIVFMDVPDYQTPS